MLKRKNDNEKNIIKNYFNHLCLGFSAESFIEKDFSSVEKMASGNEKMNEQIKAAKRKGRYKLEKVCLDELFSDDKKFNSRLWMFFMKNIYGWSDKPAEKPESKEKEIIKVKLGFADGREFEDIDE